MPLSPLPVRSPATKPAVSSPRPTHPAHALPLTTPQHTFEGVYLGPRAAHNHTVAALLGTSHLRVAWWLRWALPGEEGHHIHHANARVPCYRMQVCGGAGTRAVSRNQLVNTRLLKAWTN
jgi:fatty acid desaturase